MISLIARDDKGPCLAMEAAILASVSPLYQYVLSLLCYAEEQAG